MDAWTAELKAVGITRTAAGPYECAGSTGAARIALARRLEDADKASAFAAACTTRLEKKDELEASVRAMGGKGESVLRVCLSAASVQAVLISFLVDRLVEFSPDEFIPPPSRGD
jgi:hypothetical protein